MTPDRHERAASLHARVVEIYLDELLAAPPPRTGDPAGPQTAEMASGGAAAAAPAPASRPAADSGAEAYRLIRVAGLSIALPARDIQWHGPLEGLEIAPGPAPSWCLGRLRAEGRIRHAVDLARVIAPTLAARASRGAAIHLACGYWTLVCDAVCEPTILNPAQMRRRRPSESRPWLAGTVPAPRCAVLDVIGLTSLLSREIDHERC